MGAGEEGDVAGSDAPDIRAAGTAYLRSVAVSDYEMLLVVGADGVCRFAAGATRAITGLDTSDLVGLQTVEASDDPHRGPIQAYLARLIAAGGLREPVAVAFVDPAGRDRWLELRSTNLLDDPEVRGFVVIGRDITEQRRAEDELRTLIANDQRELRRRALHDVLTGLPNRTLLLDRLDHALDRAAVQLQAVGVLFIDLDRFKRINDTMGHQAGDVVLIELARRLRSAIRPGDTVARLGGDEFTIVCEDINDPTEASAVAARVGEALAEPIVVAGREVVITASIGIALGTGGDSEDLLRDADLAMYQAKSAGKARSVVFDASLREEATERLETEDALRQALPRGELEVCYQPVVELATDAVVGIEALVRWHHPSWGLVLPDAFIPIAEDAGLITTIGAWVLDTACAETARLRHRYPKLSIAVNLSTRQLGEPNLLATVQQALARNRLAPEALILEVTETAVLDDLSGALSVLGQLRALGVRLTIDDFGTGYSSLTYLTQLTIDEVKIDKSFTAGYGTDTAATAVVAGVIAMAKALGLRTVGEGIERPAQRAGLLSLGCDAGQGWLWSGPRSSAELESWLEERKQT